MSREQVVEREREMGSVRPQPVARMSNLARKTPGAATPNFCTMSW